MKRETVKFYYRGQVERGVGLRYEWRDGYSENSFEGRPLYPWMTKRECQKDAASRDKKAEFAEGRRI